jgi:hypothetical protein
MFDAQPLTARKSTHKTKPKDKLANKMLQKTLESDKEGAAEGLSIYDQMCVAHMASVTEAICRGCNKGGKRIVIERHQFDGARGWMESPVKHQPSVSLQAMLIPLDYGHFGYQFDNLAKTSIIKVVMDTGCQSTLIVIDAVYWFGYKKPDLFPTKMHMVAINTNDIDIIGVIILQLSSINRTGASHEMTQICIVSTKVRGYYLSEQEANAGIRNFATHVKGQAELFQFMVACICGINMQYTDLIMHVIIMHGLHDQDHQWEILGHPDRYISLTFQCLTWGSVSLVLLT